MIDSTDRPDAYTFDDYLNEKLEQEEDFADQWTVDEVVARLAYQTFRARLNRGWSQQELADQVGTGQSNISDIEHGEANPTLKTIAKIAAALDIDIADLLREDGDERIERVFVELAGDGEIRQFDHGTEARDREPGAGGWPGKGVHVPNFERAIIGTPTESSDVDTVAA